MAEDIITFIIADAKEGNFIKQFHEYRNFISRSNAVVIHDIKTFFLFYDRADMNFRFRLIIHAAIADSDQDSIGNSGLSFAGDIVSRDKFKALEFPFMTRKRALFITRPGEEESLHRIIDGYKVYNAWLFNTPRRLAEVLNDIPVLSKSDIEGAGPGLQKRMDFAVLTALYEDEFQIYMEHCTLTPDDSVANGYHSRFTRTIDAIKNDYTKPFALVHQQQMGLVDAAIYATQVIDKLDPTFLLMGGVCGGLKTGVRQFDIIIPTVVYDFGTGKLVGDWRKQDGTPEEGAPALEFTYPSSNPEAIIQGRVESKRFKAEAEKLLTEHIILRKGDILQNMRAIMPETQKANFPKEFDIHVSEFACGPWVVKTDGFLDDYLLKEFSEQIKGLEMESYSINRAGNIVQKYGRYSLVVKSVMDFTTTKKTDGSRGEIKKFAALMSLVCIRAIMPILLEFRDPKLTDAINNDKL